MKDKNRRKGVRTRKQSPFGQQLIKLLADRGISIRQAAAICEVRASVVSSWCSGGVPQDLLAVQKLCRALRYDFEALLTGTSMKFNPQELELSDLFDEETAFSGLFKIEATRLVRKGKK